MTRLGILGRLALALCVPLVLVRPCAARAQDVGLLGAERALASREQLVALAQSGSEDVRARAERRLADGDFRVGDLILLEVQGEAALTDTFMVADGRLLLLPSPTTGALDLTGVLRSELESRVRAHVARFLREPVVRARPLLRLAVTGQVARAGYYAVPLDAPIAEALMAAQGVAATGDLAKTTITRNGRRLYAAKDVRALLARGTTVDQARLRDGDEIEVGRGHAGWEERLRFLWVIISVTGGIYGITRNL